MKERKLARKFTLNANIYDVDLPQKIVDILQASPLETDPHLYYSLDLVFDKAVYQTVEFFQYPLEKFPPIQRGQAVDRKQLHDRLSAILSQQFSQVLSAVRGLGIDLSNGAVIGDDLNNAQEIFLEFYEGKEKEYDKKGRLKPEAMVTSIMPDRPFIRERAAELFTRMALDQAEEAAKKERELAAHTPHMVPAGELFTAVARAILLDKRRKADGEIEALAEQLRLHAAIRSDWPLEIAFTERPEAPMAEEFPIDCPEFLLYHEKTAGVWTLKKVSGLAAAQSQITRDGYNRKTTARMAVLHDRKPVGFTLFAETAEGLVKVKKQEAYGIKNLNLSWKK